MKENRFIKKSINIAISLYPNSNERFSHYCFIFDKNRLISLGQNCSKKENAKVKYLANKFHIEHFKRFSYPHAEISAISRLWGKQHITGRENVVVIRIGPNGLLNSKPCKNCSIILRALGFSKIYYSVQDDIEFGDL